MPNDLLTIDQIFNSRVLRIPDYQRGYAWGARETSAFWEDLKRLDEAQKHYTGQITVERVPKESWQRWDEETWLIEDKNYQPHYIVDGQQRLTTTIILLKCILDQAGEETLLASTDTEDHFKKYLTQKAGVSKAFLFGYERDNPSYNCLKSEILSEDDGAAEETETLYTSNLKRARDFFRDKLATVDGEELNRLFKALTQRFLFNWHELDDELDVFMVFETMNYRGKSLSRLELLKNRLIYLSTNLSEPENERQALRRKVNEAWKTIYSYLGRRRDHTLDDDHFLRNHWIMYYGYDRRKVTQFSEHLLDETFTLDRIRDGKLKATEIDAYVASIKDSAKFWYAIHFPDHVEKEKLSDDLRLWLSRISRQGYGASAPLLLAALLKSENDAETAHLAARIERFNFLVSWLCQRRSNTGDSRLFSTAHRVYSSKESLQEAVITVNELTQKFFDIDHAIHTMQGEENGFYSWNGKHYFLFEYEEHLREIASNETSKVDWQTFSKAKKDYHTIEHIFPQNAKQEDWPKFSTLSSEESHRNLHSLGNLVALSTHRNSSFSNRAFSAKCATNEKRAGYNGGSYSELKISKQESWNPEIIKTRGLEMLDFLETRWNCKIGDDEQRLKLLCLKPIREASPDTVPVTHNS